MDKHIIAEICAKILDVLNIQYVILSSEKHFSNINSPRTIKTKRRIKLRKPGKDYNRSGSSNRKTIDKDRWKDIRPELEKKIREMSVGQSIAFPDSSNNEGYRSLICNISRKILGRGGIFYSTTRVNNEIILYRLK